MTIWQMRQKYNFTLPPSFQVPSFFWNTPQLLLHHYSVERFCSGSVPEPRRGNFRNALVRANYQNLQKGIYKETIHIERFFRNLLMGEDNVLMNRHLHIMAKELLDGALSLPPGSDSIIGFRAVFVPFRSEKCDFLQVFAPHKITDSFQDL